MKTNIFKTLFFVAVVICLLQAFLSILHRQNHIDNFWQWVKETPYKSSKEIKVQHNNELKNGIIYKKFIMGRQDKKEIALTFDDGPHPQYTRELLELLRKYNVKATFFVVGHMAEQYPGLIKDEYSSGHLLGNHTYSHINLTKIPPNEIKAELLACNEVVHSITGYRMKYFRPPGGDYDDKVMKAAAEENLTSVLWTDDPGDYNSPGSKIIEKRVLDEISNGGIILLHDGIQQTIDILPQIIEYLREKGYSFVTVGDMHKIL